MSDKFAALMASSAKSMADSARSIELFAEMMESQMETQNALLTTLVDKLGKVGVSSGSAGDDGGKASGLSGLVSGLAKDGAKAADGMARMNEVSKEFKKTMSDLTEAMSNWEENVKPETVDNFTESLSGLVKKFEEMNFETIQKGGDALLTMSKAIALFGLTLFVSSIAYAVVGPMAALTVIPTIAGFSYVFAKVGEASESINSGAEAVGMMGLAIAGMGLAMWIAGQLAGGSIGEFAKGALIITMGIALFGYVFNLIGNMDNKIEDGAKAIAWTGIAIASIGLGLYIWNAFDISAKSVLVASLAIVTVGVAFGLIGIFDKYIEGGALALTLSAVAIATLGLAVWAFASLVTWDDLPLVATAITGTGTLFALAGLASIPIALGALALMAAGAAMAVLAIGILLLNATYKSAMSGLFASSEIDPKRDNLSVMINSIVGAFSINLVDSVLMMAGGMALIFASVAMITLSAGIWAIDRHVDSPLWQASAVDPARTNIQVMIDSIVQAFSINLVDSVLMMTGAVGLMLVSVAMITLSAGIWAIDRHVDSPLWQASAVDPGRNNMKVMIDSIVQAFSINLIDSVLMMVGSVALILASATMMVLSIGIWAIGKHVDSPLWQASTVSPSWSDGETTNFGLIVGSIVDAFSINLIDSALMLVGASALMLSGVAMLVIGASFSNLIKTWNKGSELFKTSDHDSDKTNLGLIMSSVVDAMIIGPMDLLSLYAAAPAWLMVGKAINNIGQGVADFIKIYDKGIDPAKLAEALSTVLSGVVDAIIDADDNTDWDSVEDGMKSIRGVGNSVSGIADGVQKFAELKFPVYNEKGEVVQYKTLNDGVFKNVATNMKLMIGAVAGTLTEIGKSGGETGWFSKSAGEKGADAIRGIGKDLVNIADFVEKAADLRMPMYSKDGKLLEGRTKQITPDMLGKGGRVSQNIRNMIMAITSALGEVGRNPDADQGWWSGKSTIDKGKAAIMGVGKDLKGLSEVVVNMSQVKDMSKVKTKLKMMLGAVPKVLMEVAPEYEAAGDAKDTVLKLLKSINEPLNKTISTLIKASKSNVDQQTGEKIGGAIGAVIRHLAGLESDGLNIEKLDPIISFVSDFAKYEKPIDSLSKSFGKLATDMQRFVKSYKAMDQRSISKHKELIDSLVQFSKADPGKMKAVSSSGRKLLDDINAGKVGEGTKSTSGTQVAQPAPAQGKPDEKGKKDVDPKAKPKSSNMNDVVDALAEVKLSIDGLRKSLLDNTLKVKPVGGAAGALGG